ncbi:uncharacterized protein LOC144667151 isoform X2 [Oculina patagonica]
METTMTLLALAMLLLSAKVNSFSSVNVTRLQQNDKFTNPNHTAVSKCLASGQPSSFADSCKKFRSTDTRAKCLSSNSCCGSCECKDDYPIYLVHLGKCVNLQELNSDAFGQGSTGCGGRLEVKGGGDDDDDDDDGRHGKDDVCKSKNWTPPLINFQKTSDPKMKFCRVKPKDMEWCNMQTALYLSGFERWKNLTNIQQKFYGSKIGKDILLKWYVSAVSHITGSVIIINVKCKEKGKGGKEFTSCFMFKTAGTQIATTTKPTTRKPTTTKATTTKPTTRKPTTTNPTTITTKITTKAKTTKKTTTAMEITTKPIKRTTSYGDTDSTTMSKETETTSSPETEPGQTSSELTMATTDWRSPGKDRIIDTSRDGSNNRNKTVVVVSVLCTLVAVAALSVLTVYLLRKWKRPKKAIINSDSTSHIDGPENHIYQTQDNIYQLLERDGKSTGHGQWEPPAYQGLAKGANEGAWGEGEVYANPSMYQDLKKNETTSNVGYLPAYHPLVKQHQSTAETGPEYDRGYLVLVGEHDKEQETADEEDPYYYKVEQIIE